MKKEYNSADKDYDYYMIDDIYDSTCEINFDYDKGYKSDDNENYKDNIIEIEREYTFEARKDYLGEY